MLYHDLWNILRIWKKEFTVREFASTFSSPDPNKVLHDMTRKGLLERVGWGRYRVNSPEEYLARQIDVAGSYELLKNAGLPYALTGPDAVFVWTKGGYQADRFFGFYPIHLKVKKRDLQKWRRFFKSRRKPFRVEGEPSKQTLFGVFYSLYPAVDFEAQEVDNFCVTPLKETVEFCQRNIFAFEPALEMLDEAYDLRLGARYVETKTNVGDGRQEADSDR